MKISTYLPMMALMAMLTFSCSTEEFQEDKIDHAQLKNAPAAKLIELEILELINSYRIGLDLAPLNNLSIIKSVAFTHTDYMVSVNQVSHNNFFQRKSSLVQNASATKVSENVAYAYSSAESVVSAWLDSPSHKATIEGDFTDFDISAEKNSEGKWYFTNIFIKR
ncbi:CAP domain-containing protein [Gelidibacter gilvus]|uniref:CAP domain-containing protein n=1 Tax=Gelidibacter gilvus TaxID=59602 RepID=A0A4V1LN80_9FLAO|nr:CAP domain-containing protein [Gelidibacter gilvus]RXJ51356.1 CAP domain-containing protein [Gelidibacter gilvus]